MNKKLILIMALVFVLSIGAGVGTMALYQRQLDINSNSIRSAIFNPVVKAMDENDEYTKEWKSEKVFDNIPNIHPSKTTTVGEFTINDSAIEVNSKIELLGEINSEFKGSNVKLEIGKVDEDGEMITNKTYVFEADEENISQEIEAGNYAVEIEWPKPNRDQPYIYKKNDDGSFEKLTEDEASAYNGELYTEDATYAGKTGEVKLTVTVTQED